MRFLALMLILVFVYSLPQDVQGESRLALVIGNADYRQLPPKATFANDAALMATALRQVGFQVRILDDADAGEMRRAISSFAAELRASSADRVGLFYYAGYGAHLYGESYLLPIGTEIETTTDLPLSAVSLSEVVWQLNAAGNVFNMLVLEVPGDSPSWNLADTRFAGAGLAPPDLPTRMLISVAAEAGRPTTAETVRYSSYTEALVAQMREPGLAVEMVFDRARKAVEEASGGLIKPWHENSYHGDFSFLPNVQSDGLPPGAETDNIAVELAFWNSIKDSDEVDDYRAYLTAFPNGRFTRLAELQIRVLEPGAETDNNAVELAFWDSIKDSDEVDDYRAYLAAFPNGRFSRLAELRIRVLEPGAETDNNAVELAFWDSIKDSDDVDDYRAYLVAFPNGIFTHLAELRIHVLDNAYEVARKSSPRTEAATLPPPDGVLASRIFSGPNQFPPNDFAAYGILAFPSRAAPYDRRRHRIICHAYRASLPHAFELTLPINEQMVTVWPVDSDAKAEQLNGMPPLKLCNEAVANYGLVAAKRALKEAELAGVDATNSGPFLLAWSPSTDKGKQDALVLMMDLSAVETPQQASEAFRLWSSQIEQDPQLWSHGWDFDRLTRKIDRLASKVGANMLQIFRAE